VRRWGGERRCAGRRRGRSGYRVLSLCFGRNWLRVVSLADNPGFTQILNDEDVWWRKKYGRAWVVQKGVEVQRMIASLRLPSVKCQGSPERNKKSKNRRRQCDRYSYMTESTFVIESQHKKFLY
jgi:hypothetical protein